MIPAGEIGRDVEPEHQHERRDARTPAAAPAGAAGGLHRGLAEHHRLDPAEDRGEGHAQRQQQERRRPRLLAHRRGEDQELAREDAERRHAEDRERCRASGPSRPSGLTLIRPRMSSMTCVPAFCVAWPTAKKIADLVSECTVMCSSPAKLAIGAAHAEGEGDEAHVLDRRVGEHALDVLLARQEERRDHHREQAEAHHQLPAKRDAERAVGEHLAAQHRVQRDVEQQPREHRRDRRRAFGVRIGQPVVQRHQADLGAVADEQEHERER